MLEEQLQTRERPQIFMPKNPVAYYFAQARAMELPQNSLDYISDASKESYAQELQNTYDILFDRIMISHVSPFLKGEVENWYLFNRDFLLFCDTKDMNNQLEEMLRRFELL